MMRFQPSQRGRRLVPVLVCALAAALCAAALFAAAAGARSSTGPTRAKAANSRTVVKKMKNASLGKYVLTNLKGLTLYSLSAEVRGRFICTASCLATWHPLAVPKGVTPVGPTHLGTIKRPEGSVQVTFRGRPLYTFVGDTKAGDANGEGFKDVGTWHAASLGAIVSHPTSPPPPENPYPY